MRANLYRNLTKDSGPPKRRMIIGKMTTAGPTAAATTSNIAKIPLNEAVKNHLIVSLFTDNDGHRMENHQIEISRARAETCAWLKEYAGVLL